MFRKAKYSPETKVSACEDYLSGNLSMREICAKYDIPFNEKKSNCSVHKWLHVYNYSGIEGFQNPIGNKAYTKEFKTEMVERYLRGEGSLKDLAAKYNILSDSTLQQWIMRYNANRELRITIRNGRSIWQRQGEKRLFRNAKKSLHTALNTIVIIRSQQHFTMFLTVRCIPG